LCFLVLKDFIPWSRQRLYNNWVMARGDLPSLMFAIISSLLSSPYHCPSMDDMNFSVLCVLSVFSFSFMSSFMVFSNVVETFFV